MRFFIGASAKKTAGSTGGINGFCKITTFDIDIITSDREKRKI